MTPEERALFYYMALAKVYVMPAGMETSLKEVLLVAITEAEQQERKTCAKVAEEYYKPLLRPGHPGHPIVLQIRARSQEKT